MYDNALPLIFILISPKEKVLLNYF